MTATSRKQQTSGQTVVQLPHGILHSNKACVTMQQPKLISKLCAREKSIPEGYVLYDSVCVTTLMKFYKWRAN